MNISTKSVSQENPGNIYSQIYPRLVNISTKSASQENPGKLYSQIYPRFVNISTKLFVQRSKEMGSRRGLYL